MDPFDHLCEKFEYVDQAPKIESMKLQIMRIGSFKTFPSHVRMSALKLAEAGFYYTGFMDETACFVCDLKLQDWDETSNPCEMHRRYSPECPFVNNNIETFPIGKNVPSRESFRLAQAGSGSTPSNNATVNEAQFSSGYVSQQSIPSVQPSNSVPQSDSEVLPDNRHQEFLRGRETNNNSSVPLGQLASNANRGRDVDSGFHGNYQVVPRPPIHSPNQSWRKDYRYERSRLTSFRNWPSNAAIRPNDLAEAGFYYMGTDDRVQCVFCRGILRNWEPRDDAFAEHRRHFAQCPFLANPENVGNVKLGHENFSVEDSAGSTNQELSNAHTAVTGEVLPPAEDYCQGIVKDKPIHQRYALPADRLKTFKNFPELTQTPEQFTRAGFFYSGISDNVKCFFCDGGLRNWEPNDDPWTEHGRWFPRCGYIRLCKGDEFIKEVQQRFAPPPVDSKPRRLRNSHRNKKHQVDPVRLATVLVSRTVQSVIEMGWSDEMVKEVAKRRLEDLDDEFPNAESLLDALQDYENEQKYIDTHGDSDNSQETNQEANEEANENDIPEAEAAKEGTKKKNKKKKKKGKKSAAGNTDNEKTELGGTVGEEPVPHEPYQYIDDDEAKRLAEDIQRMKDERLCKVCMDEEVNIVFLRCGHLVCCSNCAPALRHCPICRELIRGTVRVFLS